MNSYEYPHEYQYALYLSYEFDLSLFDPLIRNMVSERYRASADESDEDYDSDSEEEEPNLSDEATSVLDSVLDSRFMEFGSFHSELVPMKPIKPEIKGSAIKIGDITCILVNSPSNIFDLASDSDSDDASDNDDTLDSDCDEEVFSDIEEDAITVPPLLFLEPQSSIAKNVDLISENTKKPELVAWSSSPLAISDEPESVGTSAIQNSSDPNQSFVVCCRPSLTSVSGLLDSSAMVEGESSGEELVKEYGSDDSKIGVKQLRADTKARIRIGETLPGCDKGVVTVYIADDDTSEIENPGKFLWPAQDGLVRVHQKVAGKDLCGGGSKDNDNGEEKEDRGNHVTTKLLVLSDRIGCVIGKGGKTGAQVTSPASIWLQLQHPFSFVATLGQRKIRVWNG